MIVEALSHELESELVAHAARLLDLGALVLKPDLDLRLVEAQLVGQVLALLARQVLALVELVLESAELRGREGRARPLRVRQVRIAVFAVVVVPTATLVAIVVIVTVIVVVVSTATTAAVFVSVVVARREHVVVVVVIIIAIGDGGIARRVFDSLRRRHVCTVIGSSGFKLVSSLNVRRS